MAKFDTLCEVSLTDKLWEKVRLKRKIGVFYDFKTWYFCMLKTGTKQRKTKVIYGIF
jgi:hypothetical protein